MIAFGAFFVFVGSLLPKAERGVSEGPLLLKEVQDLGELRAVSHRVSRVFEHETHRDVEGWGAHVPLAKQVVAATTSNKVLVSADADVQAGVDLSQAKLVERGSEWTLVLPDVQVYEPVVKVRVHGQKDGLFWRDLNIVGKAQEAFADEVVTASDRAGIRERAETNIRAQMQDLLGGMTEKPVSVTFGL